MTTEQHHQPIPTAQTLIPRFLYAGLAEGSLNLTSLVLWAVIRHYAPDQKRGDFSPQPVDLTNRELAQAMRLSRRHVINVLNALEAGGWLHRLTPEEQAAGGLTGPRWLLLTRPEPVNHGAVQSVSEGEAPHSMKGVNSSAVQIISPQPKRLTAADHYIPAVQNDRNVERYG